MVWFLVRIKSSPGKYFCELLETWRSFRQAKWFSFSTPRGPRLSAERMRLVSDISQSFSRTLSSAMARSARAGISSMSFTQSFTIFATEASSAFLLFAILASMNLTASPEIIGASLYCWIVLASFPISDFSLKRFDLTSLTTKLRDAFSGLRISPRTAPASTDGSWYGSPNTKTFAPSGMACKNAAKSAISIMLASSMTKMELALNWFLAL